MPAPSYSALANWDGRLSQPHSPPSRPPSQPSLMPPPPQLPSNTARAAASSPQPRTAPPAASSLPNATSQPLASTSRARESAVDASGSRTASQSPAASTSWTWSAQIESPTRQAQFDSTRIPWSSGDTGVDATSLSSALGHGILSMHGTPVSSPSTTRRMHAPPNTQSSSGTARIPPSRTTGKATTPVPSKEVLVDEIRRHRETLNFIDRELANRKRVEEQHSAPGIQRSTHATSAEGSPQRIRAPSQTSLRSHRSSEDDDDAVQRMLLASHPSSPALNKQIFDAHSEPLQDFGTAPPPERPFALQPVILSKAHVPPSSTVPTPAGLLSTNSTIAGARVPIPAPTSALEDVFGELLYPSSASEHADGDVQASTTTLSEKSEARPGPSTESVAAPETQKTDPSKNATTSWDEWARSVTAKNAVHIDTDASTQAELPVPEPAASSEPDDAPQLPEQRKKTPLFLPSTSESRDASAPPHTPSPAQDDGPGPRATERARSPSVEVVETSVRSASSGESTLVEGGAPQAAPRRAPAPVAGPSTAAAAGTSRRRVQPASPPISIASSASPPPAPRPRGRPPKPKLAPQPAPTSRAKPTPKSRQQHRPKPPPQRAYVALWPLERARRKMYHALADVDVCEEEEESEDDVDEEEEESAHEPARPAPLSPTVSDFTRSPPPALQHPPAAPAHSPRVVPSSVSPPTRPTRAALDAPLAPLSPLSPSPALVRPGVGRRRSVSPTPRAGPSSSRALPSGASSSLRADPSLRSGPSRPARARSPAEDGWAASLSAAYNRANGVEDGAVEPAQDRASPEVDGRATREVEGGGAGSRVKKRKRVRELSVESDDAPLSLGRGLPKPRKRRRKSTGLEEHADVLLRGHENAAGAPSPPSGPSTSHPRAHSPPAAPPSTAAADAADAYDDADDAPAEWLVLEGLGGDAFDPLSDGAQTWALAVDTDFDGYVRAQEDLFCARASSWLPACLRFVFGELGVDVLGGEGGAGEREGELEERSVGGGAGGEETVEEEEFGEEDAVEEDAAVKDIEKPSGDVPDEDVDMDRPPTTPPHLPTAAVPASTSTVAMEEARETRQEKTPTPSPPQVVRQPAVQVPPRPQDDQAARQPHAASAPSQLQAHLTSSQPQTDVPSTLPADRPASPVDEVPGASAHQPAIPIHEVSVASAQQPVVPSEVPHPAFPVFPPEQETQASQMFSYGYHQTQLHSALRSDALRGQDAFLGMIQPGHDDRMDLETHDMYSGYPVEDGLLATHAQWMDAAQAIPQAFLSMPQDAFADNNMEVDHPDAAIDPSAGINPQLLAHGGIGTIDPSLLGGPATPPRAHSPTPTPTPPSGSAKRARATADDDEWGPSPKSGPKPKARRGVGPTGAAGKAKGKGRAADVGYRARQAQDGEREPGSYWAAGEPDAKRKRRPSTRVVEARARTSEGEEEGEVRAPVEVQGEKHRWTRAEIMQQAAQVPYCHQCRGKNGYEKMSCGVVREDLTKCGLKYCEKCIRLRYPDIEFNSYAISFKCPRCTNTCNCTVCCRKRGEEYVPSEGHKLGILPSALYMQALQAEAAALKAQPKTGAHSSRRSASTAAPPAPSVVAEQHSAPTTRKKPGPKPKPALQKPPKPPTQEELELAAMMALPQGAVWGTIYGLNMDRIGIGIVAEGATQKVVVARSPGPDGGMPPSTFPRAGSRTTEDSEDSEVDELLPTTPEDVRPSAAPSIRAISGTPAAGTSVRGGSVTSSAALSKAVRHFIGKPQNGWKPLPPAKDSGRGLVRYRGVPHVHAYVGVKPVDRPQAQVVDARSDASAEEDDDPFGCMSGSLTPQHSDDEGAHHASDAAQSPTTHPPPGGQDPADLGFILARALHVARGASQGPMNALSALLAVPNGVPTPADSPFSPSNRPGGAPAFGADAALQDEFEPPGLSWYADAVVADAPPAVPPTFSSPMLTSPFPAPEAPSTTLDISSLLLHLSAAKAAPSPADLPVVRPGAGEDVTAHNFTAAGTGPREADQRLHEDDPQAIPTELISDIPVPPSTSSLPPAPPAPPAPSTHTVEYHEPSSSSVYP
ncbi:hypothetical protein PsYK624_054820 [Phanerochaete sordida]|uniref:Zinc-finger domain-containing protein n=1 Tax=Phanerochaete sordida TaxID=48140 RepID=A0A9P3LCZ6_9APHY|nr:hypothetical protein PsYK624_054820 [Phanerochaete sordida]